MIDHMLTDALIIVHQALAAVSDADVEEALAPAKFTPTTRTARIDGTAFRLDRLAEEDWDAAHDALVAELDARVVPMLDQCSGPVHYLGMPPIPLAIELGRRLGPTRRVVAYQQRHDTKSWRWPASEESVKVALHGAPATAAHAKGDVIIRVGSSHPISLDDARAVVPFPIGELSVEVDGPHEDVLCSDLDVMRVASKFGEALDCVRRLYPNCDMIHLFASVPPALALRLGAEINPTIHHSIQTYQFDASGRPRYRKALLIGERPRSPLTRHQVDAAGRARGAFAHALEQLQALRCDDAPTSDWLADLVGSGADGFPASLRAMGPLGRNAAIFGAAVSMDAREAGGEFRWAPDRRAWIFDDRLLCALAERLADHDLWQAARLFLLHEAIHYAKQGVTSATAERVGRLPRVLEEADYLADLWALVHEYGRARGAGETTEQAGPEFFRSMLQLMTATFWAFDAGDVPLRAVQVRRLNRYLIWYWQRLRLENADSLPDVARILGSKPVLEVSGPRIITSRGRVLFDLDPAWFEAVEFGVLHGGFRIVRIGARPGAQVGGLLASLRDGNEASFIAALRGIFDSVENEGRA